MITESSKKCHFGIMPITTQQNFLNKNLIITESSKKYVIITISSRFFFFFSFFSPGGGEINSIIINGEERFELSSLLETTRRCQLS